MRISHLPRLFEIGVTPLWDWGMRSWSKLHVFSMMQSYSNGCGNYRNNRMRQCKLPAYVQMRGGKLTRDVFLNGWLLDLDREVFSLEF